MATRNLLRWALRWWSAFMGQRKHDVGVTDALIYTVSVTDARVQTVTLSDAEAIDLELDEATRA